MFVVEWQPDPSFRDEIDLLGEYEDAFAAFRSERFSGFKFHFDGDGWSSQEIGRLVNVNGKLLPEVGVYYIGLV